MPAARPTEQVRAAAALCEAGLTDRAVGERLGIPTETVRKWRGGRLSASARLERAGVVLCEGCGEAAHDPSSLPADVYAYLLGLYLGDGCIGQGRGPGRAASTTGGSKWSTGSRRSSTSTRSR